MVMLIQGPPDVERCNKYPVIGEPPSSGAVQLKKIEFKVLVPCVGRAGVDGIVTGWVVIVWGSENVPLPAEFMAAIL